MHEESRVPRGDERVRAGIPADGEVPAAVDTEGLADVAGVALENPLEDSDVGRGENCGVCVAECRD